VVQVCCGVLQCVAMCHIYFSDLAAKHLAPARGGAPILQTRCGQVMMSMSQCGAVCRSVLHYSAVQCSAVQCSAVQSVAVCCSVIQCDTVQCSVVQRVAVCCSVLQCVVVCCGVMRACCSAILLQCIELFNGSSSCCSSCL